MNFNKEIYYQTIDYEFGELVDFTVINTVILGGNIDHGASLHIPVAEHASLVQSHIALYSWMLFIE